MRVSARWVFLGLALAAFVLLAAGLTLGEVFRLQPCYWCNFQRVVYMALIVVGLLGGLFPRARRIFGALAALVALIGVWAAGEQSWMQYAPQQVVECGFGNPTLTERLVDWLATLWPSMFMVTGLCKETDWVFLGLSLANWSGICFFLLFLVAAWLTLRRAGK